MKELAGVTTVNWVTSILIWLQRSDQWNHKRQGHWHPAPVLSQDKPTVLSPPSRMQQCEPWGQIAENAVHQYPQALIIHIRALHTSCINKIQCTCYSNILRLRLMAGGAFLQYKEVLFRPSLSISPCDRSKVFDKLLMVNFNTIKSWWLLRHQPCDKMSCQ